MAHAINLVLRDMSVHQILSIQVDALYISVPRGKLREIQKTFSEVSYSMLPFNKSEAIVYKVTRKEARFPGGVLKLEEGTAPEVKQTQWKILKEHDNF